MENGVGSNLSSPSKPTMPTSENGNGVSTNASNVTTTSDSGSSSASHRDLLPQHLAGVANGEGSMNSSGGTATAPAQGPPTTAPSTPGAPGSMGPPPLPHYHMSSPAVIPPAQIRSRITVVCAECKRLKLKCDRRMPCGSCSKRDTIARCIYSPAAAEKVDVQSIHNRLLVVEGNMANLPTMLANTVAANINSSLANSAASTPLPSSSTLPSAILGSTTGNTPSRLQSYSNMNIGLGIRLDSSVGAGPGPSTRRARILARDARGASVVVNLDGVTGLWMGELETELGRDSSAPTSSNVKRPNIATQLTPIDRRTSSAPPYVPQLVLHTHAAPPESPAIVLSRHLGFNVSFDAADPVPLGLNGDDISSEDTYAALISQLTFRLPTEQIRGELMRRLEATLAACGAPSLPSNWFRGRIESLFSKGKGKNTGSVPGSNSSDVPTLSLVAVAAAAFAIGALSLLEERENDCQPTPTNSSASGTPIYGLDSYDKDRRMATTMPVPSSSPGVASSPEIHASTPRSLYRLARLALELHIERHGQASYDPEFIYAYILSARYLLLAKSRANRPARPNADPCLPPEIPPLMGELVWHARIMGLGVDPDDLEEGSPPESTAPSISSSFAAITGSLPISSVASSFSGTSGGGSERSRGTDRRVKREEGEHGPFGSGTGRQGSMTPFMKEIRRRLWWEVLWLDLLVTEYHGHNPTISAEEYNTRLPTDVDDDGFDPSSTSLPPPSEKSNISFFIVKCRLYEFLRHIHVRKSREVRAVSANGTEDADFATARALANELTLWLDSIPEKFKVADVDELTSLVLPETPPMASLLPVSGSAPAAPPSEPSPSTFLSPAPSIASPVLLMQRCEFLMITQHLITKLFLPRPRITGTNNGDRPPDKNARPGPQLSGLFGIEPALVVVSAAQVLHDTYLRTRTMQSTFYRVNFPRLVFDAAVVLAYIAIQQPLYTAGSVLDAVQVALRLLRQFSGSSEVKSAEGSPSEAVMVVEKLLEKAKASHRRSSPIVSGMKRKHEEVDEGTSDAFRKDFRLPFAGAGVVNTEVHSSTEEPAMETDEIVFMPITSHRSETSGHASSKARYSTTSESRPPTTWPPTSGETRPGVSKHRNSIPTYSVRNRSGTSRMGGDESGRSRTGSVSSRHSTHTAPMSGQPSVVPRPQQQVQHSDPSVAIYHGPSGPVPPQHFRPPDHPPSEAMHTPRPDSAYSVTPGGSYPQQFTPVQTSPTHPYDFYRPSSSTYSQPSSHHQSTYEAAMGSHTSLPDLSTPGHGIPESPQERHYRNSMEHSTVGMQPLPGSNTNAQPFHSHGLGLDQPLMQSQPPPPPEPHSQPPRQDHSWSEPVQIHGPQSQQQHWDGTYSYWNNE